MRSSTRWSDPRAVERASPSHIARVPNDHGADPLTKNVDPSGVRLVERWLAAANAGGEAAVLALTAHDVRIIGPRGTSQGHDVLRAWLAHAGATFTSRAIYARGDQVVVAQHGIWRDSSGTVRGEADVATRFRLAAELVLELERYDTLDEALAAAQLTTANAVD